MEQTCNADGGLKYQLLNWKTLQTMYSFKLTSTMQSIQKFLGTASGTAIGTLLYTTFLSAAQTPDWGRAAFVGIVCGIIAVVWPRKSNSSSEQG